MQLLIKTKSFDKDYLIHVSSYDFENALEFVFELFSKHEFLDREAELYLYQLLKDTGYGSIEAIPIPQLNSIVNYFLKNRDQYKLNYDLERMSYLMLASLKDKKVLMSIDNKVIEDLLAPIQLYPDSVVSFFNIGKMEAIQFKSL